MEPETVAVCAALWTGIVWSFGALSTWLAVKPLRRRLEMLDAWRERLCDFGQKASEETSRWAGRVDALLEAHGDVLNAQQARLKGLDGDVEGLRCAVRALGGFEPDRLRAPRKAVKSEEKDRGARG